MSHTQHILDRHTFLHGDTSKKLLLLNVVMAVFYFLALTFLFTPGNRFLFGLLIAGEAFHLFQIIGFCHTIWDSKVSAKFNKNFSQPVDVFITVCGEPTEIVEETARAALAMDYPRHSVYLLNDGYVANRDNWQEMETLANHLGITCITRTEPGGAKAGNINHALRKTQSPFVVIFDADHVPHRDFLQQTMGFFTDPRMGFVQTPQFYKNQYVNNVADSAWHQQTLFFGPIMSGKNRTNSAFMCGTNMVIRRSALLEAGGMCETNIAEDFLTSLFIHAKRWKSLYIPRVLAEGLAPEDFLSYYKQQFRWTRGSLEVVFRENPFFKRGLTLAQKLQYIFSASYYLSGTVVLIDALLPLIFLFTGITTVQTHTMNLALIFMPYIFLNLYLLQKSSNASYSFAAICFSLSSFYIQIKALISVLARQKTSFSVTSKSQVEGNFLHLAYPQMAYVGVSVIGLGVGLMREGLSTSLMANLAWVIINIIMFMPFILAASPLSNQRSTEVSEQTETRLQFVPSEANK